MLIVLCPFQFQTGSIKSKSGLHDNKDACVCFNSKLVRLEDIRKYIPNVTKVSIPNWCD